MKSLLSFFLLFALVSCTPEKLDEAEAQKTAESTLEALKVENYDALYAFYSSDFANSESAEERTNKYKQIFGATGKIVSYELTNTRHIAQVGDEAELILTYKVTHERLTTQMDFTLMKEEGRLAISALGIQNQ